MKILIIGSDSFIAQKFVCYSDINLLQGISRTKVQTNCDIVIKDFFKIDEYFFEGMDIIINFAAIVHRPDIKDPDIYNEVNHKLTIINAKKAKNAGVKLFIQMSTIAVYGNSQNISINSSYQPQTPYGISKLKADEALLKMQDDHFKVAIIRPPMVYGGGKAPGNMLRLINLANKGIPLPFKGINNKRDFIHVNNLIQYLSIIAEKQLDGIHLISDHQPVSTEYLLNTISKYLDKKVPLIKIPKIGLKLLKKFRPKDYEKLFGSITIETNFPFENLINRHSVEEGISEMIEWYTSNKKS